MATGAPFNSVFVTGCEGVKQHMGWSCQLLNSSVSVGNLSALLFVTGSEGVQWHWEQSCWLFNGSVSVGSWDAFQHSCLLQAAKMWNNTWDAVVDHWTVLCQLAAGVPFNTCLLQAVKVCNNTRDKAVDCWTVVSVGSWGTFQHSCLLQAAKVCSDAGDKAVDCWTALCQLTAGAPFYTLVCYRLRRCAMTLGTKLHATTWLVSMRTRIRSRSPSTSSHVRMLLEVPFDCAR